MSGKTTAPCAPARFALDPPTPGTACLLCCPALDLPGITHGFATRRGWDAQGRPREIDFRADRLATSRETTMGSLCRRLEVAPDRLFTVRQVHGTRVIEVSAGVRPSHLCEAEADALITALPGTAVAIRTADCAPLLIADPTRGVLAAVHVGWRGAVAGIVERTVERMVGSHGCHDASLVAAVGPAIGPRAFETGPEVAERFTHLEGVVHRPDEGQRPHVDLKLAVFRLLQRCGVVEVSVSDRCTFDHADRFHSYRRDGQAAGRQLSAIGLSKR